MKVVWFGDWEGSGWTKTRPNFAVFTKKPAKSICKIDRVGVIG